jgi:hypothetical protein
MYLFHVRLTCTCSTSLLQFLNLRSMWNIFIWLPKVKSYSMRWAKAKYWYFLHKTKYFRCLVSANLAVSNDPQNNMSSTNNYLVYNSPIIPDENLLNCEVVVMSSHDSVLFSGSATNDITSKFFLTCYEQDSSTQISCTHCTYMLHNCIETV